jgi:hypothetical protein
MLAKAWRFLLCGGLGIGLAAATGCSSDEDPPGNAAGSGASGGSGGSAGTTGGSAGSGVGGATGGAGTGSGGAGTGGAPAGGSSGTGAGTAGTGAGAGGAGTSGAGGGAGTSGGAGGSAGSNVGGAGAAGTGGGGAAATLVGEIDRGGGDYVLEFSDGLFFKVNTAGARILDVHIGTDANLLTGSDINAVNFGSTFWPSPQDWEWPPTDTIPEINNGPYTATVASPSVSFVGQANAGLSLQVNKKFTADVAKGTIVVDYTMIATAADMSYAPWEITRFFKRGLTFYPTGSAPTAQPGTSFEIVPTTDGAGCTWYDATANPPQGTDQKLIADGTGGWLAHVDGSHIVVKKFQDIPASAAAPNENEIAIYASAADNYIEVEQEGAYGVVPMDTGVTWTVTWYVRKLPDTITPSVGNQMLVDYVTALVQ